MENAGIRLKTKICFEINKKYYQSRKRKIIDATNEEKQIWIQMK